MGFVGDIANILSKNDSTKEQLKICADGVDIPISDIDIEGASYKAYFNLIEYADKHHKVSALIDFVVNKGIIGEKFKNSLYKLRDYNADEYLNKLAKDIFREQCVLFLGPNVCYVDKIPVHKAFAKHLARQLSKHGILYDDNYETRLQYIAQRFTSIDNYAIGDINVEAQRFYRHIKSDIYEKVVKMPFKVIINTNPDELLVELLKKQNVDVHYDYHALLSEEQQSQDQRLNPEHTIVYNIFGGLSERQNPPKRNFSAIFTEKDLVDYTKSIMLHKSIPKYIKSSLLKKSFLFIGFDFEQWHLKLLIDALGLPKEKKRTISFFSLEGVNITEKEFYEQEFYFDFLSGDTAKFLDILTNKVEAEKLRQIIGTPPNNPYNVSIIYNNSSKINVSKIADELSKYRGFFTCWSRDIDDFDNRMDDSKFFIIILENNYTATAIEQYIEKALKMKEVAPSKKILLVKDNADIHMEKLADKTIYLMDYNYLAERIGEAMLSFLK